MATIEEIQTIKRRADGLKAKAAVAEERLTEIDRQLEAEDAPPPEEIDALITKAEAEVDTAVAEAQGLLDAVGV